MTLDHGALTAAVVPGDVVSDAEWSALADRGGVVPFSRPEWVMAWAEMTGRRLLVATIRHGDALVAAYPVVGGGRRVRTAADWHLCEVAPVGDPVLWARLVSVVATGRSQVVIDMAGESDALVFAASLEAAGFRVRERVRARSPWVDLTIGWDAYRSSLPSRKWRELRRRRRRLDELGVVSFTEHDGSENLGGLLADGFQVEGAGWKGVRGTAIAADDAVAAFYRRIAADLAARGELCLRFLRLDGRAIAFDLAFVHNGAEWLVKTGFDPALSALSPGSLLRAEALERACRAGLARYEFLGSDDPWKLEWTDRTRPVVMLEAFAPGIAGRAAEVGSRVARRARVVVGRLRRSR